MTPQDQSKLAGEILVGLRGDNDPAEVAHPGAAPDVSRLNPEAAGKVQAAYDKRMEAHIETLLKPGRKLSAEEQVTLTTELGKWRGEERR